MDFRIFRNKFLIFRVAGVNKFRDDFDFAKTEADKVFVKGDFDNFDIVRNRTQNFLKRARGNDGFDFALDFVDKLASGETIAVGGSDNEFVAIGVKEYTGESGAS